ncbi:MAG: glycosyltransferase, partial [Verrucomicrobia bacterium]|nr:glycosyltransferase [Verrucomicrobiota bacterium]
PRRNNIHWLGLRSYEQLPSYAKAFNVCMVPFALNQATEYVNPTKVLEYMAAGRPVVTTAVEDIVIQFGHIAKIAKDRNDFVNLCQREAYRPDTSAINAGLLLAAENSWEAVVNNLERHIEEFLSSGAIARVNRQ